MNVWPVQSQARMIEWGRVYATATFGGPRRAGGLRPQRSLLSFQCGGLASALSPMVLQGLPLAGNEVAGTRVPRSIYAFYRLATRNRGSRFQVVRW